jgi:hypothetical protein
VVNDDRRVRHLVAYFLQDLPSEAASALEDAYLTDPGLFAHVTRVETALVHGYLAGRLSADRARRFEDTYLASDSRKRRVEAARGRLPAPPPAVLPPRRLPRLLGCALRKLRTLVGSGRPLE